MDKIRAGLPVREAHEQLLCALAELRRAERGALLCFAEIQERKLYRELDYSSIQLYAQEALGFSRSKTFQFLRLAESFDRLPKLKSAVAKGEVSWTKAREVVKVASRRIEARWIREAKTCSSRQLERKVVAAKAASEAKSSPQTSLLDCHRAEEGTSPPASGPLPLEAQSVKLSLSFTAEQFGQFESLLETLRKRGEKGSREELILAALDAMGHGHSGSAPGERAAGSPSEEAGRKRRESPCGDFSSPRQIIIYRCEDCGKASVQSSRGLLPMSSAEAAVAECDARVLVPGERNRATIPPALRREVLARDRHRCRVKGCGRAHFLEVHHLVPRSAGGENRPENLVTLCASCHRLLHERGLAEDALDGLLRASP